MRGRVVIPFLAVSLIWGSTWLFIKIGLAYFPPFLFAALRAGIAALALLVYLRIRATPLPRTWAGWWPALLYGVFEGIGFLFVFWGELYIPSGIASVIVALDPLIVVFLSLPFLAERIDFKSVGSAVLGLVGVLLATTNVNAPGFVGNDAQRYTGLGMLVLTAIFYAQATILGKKYVRNSDPALTSFIQLFAMVALLGMAAALYEPVATPLRLTPIAIGALLYLSLIGSALAFILYFQAMDHMRAAELSLLTVISPILAIFLGAVILGESAGWHVILGASLVLASLLWMNGTRLRLSGRARRAPSASGP